MENEMKKSMANDIETGFFGVIPGYDLSNN